MASLFNLSMNKCPDFCDICEEERPRWYCAVDRAYLCDKCDSSVHEANCLALRHDRVALGYNEQAQKVPGTSPGRDELVLSKIKHETITTFDSCCNWTSDPFQKVRKGRSNDANFQRENSPQNSFIKIDGITFTRATKVQLDSDSRFGDEREQLDSFIGLRKCRESENCSVFHEVPVLVPVAQDMPPTALQDVCRQSYPSSLTAHPEDASICDFMGFLVPECYDVDDSPVSYTEHINKDEESGEAKIDETVSFGEPNEEKECNDSKIDSFRDEFILTGHVAQSSSYYGYEDYRDSIAGNFHSKYTELNVFKHSVEPEVFVPLALVCEKLKIEIASGLQIDRQLEGTINGPSMNDIINSETQNLKSFNLRLNYEDVLSAWSDRGCCWKDAHSPQTVPTNSRSQLADEAAVDVGIVPELSYESASVAPENKEEMISCTTLNGGREARVLRYREKRRTRLFSKKIRYEVRKLNAERRPRIKGRFVKKSS